MKLVENCSRNSRREEKDDLSLSKLKEVIRLYNDASHAKLCKIYTVRDKYISFPLYYYSSSGPYTSTLWFIDALTDISNRLLTSENRKEMLEEELKKLNLKLPAKVYLPFQGRSNRKCGVLHIPAAEARIFVTKERCPYLITIETFDPCELRARKSTVLSTVADSTMNYTAEDDIIPTKLTYSSSTFRHTFDASATVESGKNSIAEVYASDFPIQPGQYSVAIKETAQEQAKRIRQSSIFGELKSWKIARMIVKAGDDLRQEQLAMQILYKFQQIFKETKQELWLRPYDILATKPGCGLIEAIPDALSLDSIKKKLPTEHTSLIDYFRLNFGQEGTSQEEATN